MTKPVMRAARIAPSTAGTYATPSQKATCYAVSSARRWSIEPLISHQDVTTIMSVLSDIQFDVGRIRRLLEDEDGEEEEAPEDDT